MTSESTRFLGQPRETKPTLGAGADGQGHRAGPFLRLSLGESQTSILAFGQSLRGFCGLKKVRRALRLLRTLFGGIFVDDFVAGRNGEDLGPGFVAVDIGNGDDLFASGGSLCLMIM